MGTNPTPDSIIEHLLDRFEGTRVVEAWGERSIFYNPGLILPRGVYFATVKEKDGENDKASQLDRTGVFRFNVGTTKPLFLEQFGHPLHAPARVVWSMVRGTSPPPTLSHRILFMAG